MKRAFAVGFLIVGAVNWHWPGFNGYFFPPSDIAIGDGRIIAAILMVGGAILWFMPERPKD